MPNHWLLKTEPGTFSWLDLVRDGRATWDGVKNPAALKHLRAMRSGDLAFFYHTGGEKSVVGICRVVSEPYADPKAADPRLMVVDVEPVKPLPRPVSLAAIKADRQFTGFSLVRIPRLSVMPVTPDQWRAIQAMA